jgi:hypothetical protein
MGHGDHAKCGEDYWGKFFQCVECQLKDLKCPDAPVVNVAESSSPMPGLSPKQEQEDYQTLIVQMANLLETFEEALTRVENRMTKQAAQIALMQATLNRLVESLAEDQDPDEMPARYMDGKLV